MVMTGTWVLVHVHVLYISNPQGNVLDKIQSKHGTIQ